MERINRSLLLWRKEIREVWQDFVTVWVLTFCLSPIWHHISMAICCCCIIPLLLNHSLPTNFGWFFSAESFVDWKSVFISFGHGGIFNLILILNFLIFFFPLFLLSVHSGFKKFRVIPCRKKRGVFSALSQPSQWRARWQCWLAGVIKAVVHHLHHQWLPVNIVASSFPELKNGSSRFCSPNESLHMTFTEVPRNCEKLPASLSVWDLS